MIKFIHAWESEIYIYKYGEFRYFSNEIYYFANDIWVKANSREEFDKLMKMKSFW